MYMCFIVFQECAGSGVSGTIICLVLLHPLNGVAVS